MGRKPLSSVAKFNRFVIMLTDSEREEIESAAALAGAPASTWARDLLLSAARSRVESNPSATAPKKRPVKKRPAD